MVLEAALARGRSQPRILLRDLVHIGYRREYKMCQVISYLTDRKILNLSDKETIHHFISI
jgi:hypothetical protein